MDVVVSIYVESNFLFLQFVLTLIDGIVVCGRGAVLTFLKLVEVGSTQFGETVSFLLVAKEFIAFSLGFCFLECSEDDG